MDIASDLKVNILVLVIANGYKEGVALGKIGDLYHAMTNQAAPYRELGYATMMQFFQAMPDIFRLKYSVEEESWKVYPRLRNNPFLPDTRTIHPAPTDHHPSQDKQHHLEATSTDDQTVEILVSNLHNHYAIKKVHLQDLFPGYHLLDMTVRYNSENRSQEACVKVESVSEARRLISQFNRRNFLGRNLVISLKDKPICQTLQKDTTTTLSPNSSTKCPQKCESPQLEPLSNSSTKFPQKCESPQLEPLSKPSQKYEDPQIEPVSNSSIKSPQKYESPQLEPLSNSSTKFSQKCENTQIEPPSNSPQKCESPQRKPLSNSSTKSPAKCERPQIAPLSNSSTISPQKCESPQLEPLSNSSTRCPQKCQNPQSTETALSESNPPPTITSPPPQMEQTEETELPHTGEETTEKGHVFLSHKQDNTEKTLLPNLFSGEWKQAMERSSYLGISGPGSVFNWHTKCHEDPALQQCQLHHQWCPEEQHHPQIKSVDLVSCDVENKPSILAKTVFKEECDMETFSNMERNAQRQLFDQKSSQSAPESSIQAKITHPEVTCDMGMSFHKERNTQRQMFDVQEGNPSQNGNKPMSGVELLTENKTTPQINDVEYVKHSLMSKFDRNQVYDTVNYHSVGQNVRQKLHYVNDEKCSHVKNSHHTLYPMIDEKRLLAKETCPERTYVEDETKFHLNKMHNQLQTYRREDDMTSPLIHKEQKHKQEDEHFSHSKNMHHWISKSEEENSPPVNHTKEVISTPISLTHREQTQNWKDGGIPHLTTATNIYSTTGEISTHTKHPPRKQTPATDDKKWTCNRGFFHKQPADRQMVVPPGERRVLSSVFLNNGKRAGDSSHDFPNKGNGEGACIQDVLGGEKRVGDSKQDFLIGGKRAGDSNRESVQGGKREGGSNQNFPNGRMWVSNRNQDVLKEGERLGNSKQHFLDGGNRAGDKNQEFVQGGKRVEVSNQNFLNSGNRAGGSSQDFLKGRDRAGDSKQHFLKGGHRAAGSNRDLPKGRVWVRSSNQHFLKDRNSAGGSNQDFLKGRNTAGNSNQHFLKGRNRAGGSNQDFQKSRERAESSSEEFLRRGGQISALELRLRQSETEIPCLFVTNFHRNTTKEEIWQMFAEYRPVSIDLGQCSHRGLMKAVVELRDVDSVRRAVRAMNQQIIRGLNLKVDVPFFLPRLRAAVFGDHSPPTLPAPSPPCVEDTVAFRELASAHHQVVQLIGTRDVCLRSGDQALITVTSVVSDSLLFGHVMRQDLLYRLQGVMEEMNKVADSLPRPSTQSTHRCCLALNSQDATWHRGWILPALSTSSKADVYFLDLGLRDMVAWQHIRFYDNSSIWLLQPLALPLSLTEAVVRLKDRLQSRITVDVNFVCQDGIVICTAVSLAGDHWKQLVDSQHEFILRDVWPNLKYPWPNKRGEAGHVTSTSSTQF